MPEERYPEELFTRRQVAELTGIDPSTLNYWMREGVLRPSKGGQGRGSHRLFPYWEVTLGALLKELRGFGIGLNALAGLARRFHDAVDWMDARGIDRSNYNRVFSAYLIRSTLLREGTYIWNIRSEEEREYFADFDQHVDGRGPPWVELDWEQAVAHHFRPRPAPSDEFKLVPEEIATVASWNSREDLQTFRDHSDYYNAISTISFLEPGVEVQTTPDRFVRDADGGIALDNGPGDEPPLSFIGIDLEVLTYRLWVLGAGL